MFEVESHDAATLSEHLGSIPVAGIFAQGELGPVGGKTYMALQPALLHLNHETTRFWLILITAFSLVPRYLN